MKTLTFLVLATLGLVSCSDNKPLQVAPKSPPNTTNIVAPIPVAPNPVPPDALSGSVFSMKILKDIPFEGSDWHIQTMIGFGDGVQLPFHPPLAVPPATRCTFNVAYSWDSIDDYNANHKYPQLVLSAGTVLYLKAVGFSGSAAAGVTNTHFWTGTDQNDIGNETKRPVVKRGDGKVSTYHPPFSLSTVSTFDISGADLRLDSVKKCFPADSIDSLIKIQ